MRYIDLRSDTFTRPTEAMRQAMLQADVGDDVWGEDPTVNSLEERAAAISGKEAAMYVVSGTMANGLAIRVQTQPGDEVLMHALAHPFHHEAGAPAALFGVTIRPLPGDRGCLDLDALFTAIHPEIRRMSMPTLVELENTHNAAGGVVIPQAHIQAACDIAHEAGLKVHIDGARVFNASVASGLSVAEIAAPADTISFCLSKGLGAPVGSLLCGPADVIARARRFRHMMGGGWRQAGLLAAAGHYALDHHVSRLTFDHSHAKQIAEAIESSKVARLLVPVETNIVLFETVEGISDQQLISRFKQEFGILMAESSPGIIRIVTHLDVSESDTDQVCKAFADA